MTQELQAVTDTASPPDTLIAGRYRILELVGSGGMARVYRARDEFLGRDVALKQLRADAADADGLRRQQDEIRTIAALQHPAVVTLYDAFPDEEGRVVLVMQYVAGSDLRRVLDDGPLAPAQVVAIGAALADALASVHAAGIVHRDIKPGNILVLDAASTGPAAMLGDFGIARVVDGTGMTAAGSVIGTAAYLSPEQALGRPVTPATDLYSLGLVLIECLTGEPSFPGQALESAAARLRRDPQIPHGLAPDFAALLADLTARDPAERPSAAEAAARFSAIGMNADGEPEDTLPLGQEAIDTVPFGATRVMPAPGETGAGPSDAGPSGAAAGSAPSVVGGPRTTDAPVVADEPGATPASDRRRSNRRGFRVTLWIVVALVVLAIAAAVGWWVWTALAQPDASPAPAYPAVEGELGAVLEQLQDAVEP